MRRRASSGLLLLILLLAACTSPGGGIPADAGPVALSRESSGSAPLGAEQEEALDPVVAAGPFAPVRIIIPSLGVDAPVVASQWHYHRDGGKEQSVPPNPAVGWISAEGALVGDDGGNVVFTGHNVEGADGVFDNLPALQPGDQVWLYNEQGEVRTGQVGPEGSQSIAKVAFGSVADRVYYGPDSQQWVLVGCTGPLLGDGLTHRDSAYVVITPD